MSRSRRYLLPLLAALAFAGLLVAVSACGYSSDSKNVKEGEPVKLGDLKYNVIFSRYLNPNDNEDAAYLKGLKPAQAEHNYFGVFLQVKNPTHETISLVKELWMTDAVDNKYDSIENESEYAFPFGEEVTENESIPLYDSTAQNGVIEGSVVIFEVPEEVSADRPLLLHIPGPAKDSGIVKLDL